MGFTHSTGGDRMPDMVAKLTNIGFDYQKYRDGKEEHRLIIVLTPEDKDARIQTDWISTGSVLKLSGEKQTVMVGGGDNSFELNLVGDLVEVGDLQYKSSVWLDKLESLEIPIPSQTGDMKELLGLKAKWHQTTYNEAVGRKAKDSEKMFWVPVELIAAPTPHKSLKQDLLAALTEEGRTEDKVIEWYKHTDHYNGTATTPVILLLDSLEKSGEIEKDEAGLFVAKQ